MSRKMRKTENSFNKNKRKNEVFEVSEEALKNLPWVFASARLILVANKIKIFELLSKGRGKSVEEITTELECNRENIEKFLIACEALGLLKSHGSKYFNTDFSEKYFVKESKHYIGSWIEHCYDLWNTWSELESWINCRAEVEDKSWHEKLVLGLYEITINDEAKELAKRIKLGNKKHMLDLGGGAGSFSVAFCKRYKKLRATVFDLPESIKIAREKVKENKLESRVSFIAGDWDKDDFGYGYDVVLMSNILHGRESKAEIKLRKAYNAMEKNGMLIIRDFLLKERKSGKINKKAALFNLMVGAYTFDELKQEIEKANFKNVKKLKLPRNFQNVILAWK